MRGRELDALVAEKVFGFTEPPEWLDACGRWRKEFSPYSTDIAAAWEVTEHLQLWVFPHEGRWYAGRINAEAYIDILPADIHALAPLSDRAVVDGRFAILEGADTAPLAICRAALAAVGSEIPV